MIPTLLSYAQAVRRADGNCKRFKKCLAVVSVGHGVYYVTTLSKAVENDFDSIVYTTN
jgi:hypothetical protein